MYKWDGIPADTEEIKRAKRNEIAKLWYKNNKQKTKGYKESSKHKKEIKLLTELINVVNNINKKTQDKECDAHNLGRAEALDEVIDFMEKRIRTMKEEIKTIKEKRELKDLLLKKEKIDSAIKKLKGE